MTTTLTTALADNLKARVIQLKLHGLLAHWNEISHSDWLEKIIGWEEAERLQRGLETRIKKANLGRFKSLAEFDWKWPKHCDRELVEECFRLDFIKEATNIILSGPNGVGKSTIARNIGHQAALRGYSVLFVNAARMLSDLAAQDGDYAFKRRLRYYLQPAVLIIDEIGYFAYSERYADLLFAIISDRYEEKPTVITTNKAFSEWGDVFPNATCAVSLVDRLIHHAEIINISGESFRMKDAKERCQQRAAARVQKGKIDAEAKSKTEDKDKNGDPARG